jgi:hypothetical protein
MKLFTDQQIASALRQAGTSTRVAEVCWKMRSEPIFSREKEKFGSPVSPR